MNYRLKRVQLDEKQILRNMLELYFYDMSEFDDESDRLELNAFGLYGYKYLDHYWTEEGRAAYFAYADDKLAGFVMIRPIEIESSTYEIAEFFVLKKYSKCGIGKYMMSQVFDKYKGHWIISTPVTNSVARIFWTKIANQYALNGNITEQFVEDARRYQWEFDVG